MRPLKVISVHNHYLIAGGEDQVFESEARLLREHGHDVTQVEEQNVYPDSVSKKIGMAADCVWSRRWHREFRELLRKSRPDVVHVHNFFPRISPSIYYACRQENVPVVQTLHNYRLLCAGAELYREGKVCEECLDHGVLRGIRYGCYQGSKLGTAVLTVMVDVHRRMRTWTNLVDCYIALTEFSRKKLITGGLPAERIRVKPNFVLPDPGAKTGQGEYVLFVGRLFQSKGVGAMLDAWKELPNVPLQIVGDGPCREQVEAELKTGKLPSVTYRGRLPRAETLAAMKNARALIFPSEWYEGFPVTIAEAFACGLPVIGSRLGAMEEIIEDGETGMHFALGDMADFRQKMRWAWEHPVEMQEMGRRARRVFEEKYTAEQNIRMLEEVYRFAMGARGRPVGELEPAGVTV
ncbi:MAG TPA: glycosyltransferase family 4 protein [Candidatus Binatia bacterium]|nr:glycosyltransferase family 4 protein [Candidatus Binatia bacterium]